jgi:hypothetical protein
MYTSSNQIKKRVTNHTRSNRRYPGEEKRFFSLYQNDGFLQEKITPDDSKESAVNLWNLHNSIWKVSF